MSKIREKAFITTLVVVFLTLIIYNVWLSIPQEQTEMEIFFYVGIGVLSFFDLLLAASAILGWCNVDMFRLKWVRRHRSFLFGPERPKKGDLKIVRRVSCTSDPK